MSNFNAYSSYYDLLYKDKKYKEEADYVLNRLQKFAGKTISSILELGSGSGSHADHFCRKGYKVTGIERSPEMVEKALNKKIKNFKPQEGNIEEFSLQRKFDAAVSLFHVISYLTDNDALIKCFTSTAAHLKSGGIFLFDIWYTPAVYNLKPQTRIKRMEDDQVSIFRLTESDVNFNNNTVNVNYEILVTDKQNATTSMIKETHPMRHFSLPEIQLLAEFTGFKFIKAEEFLTKNKPDENTWGVCIILQKNKL